MTQEELTIYSNGIVHCSICTNIKGTALIENTVNAKNPLGPTLRWRVSKEPTFAGGQSNPCPCEQKPNTHKHHLMVC